MEYLSIDTPVPGAQARASRFAGQGGAEELHLSVLAPPGGTFERRLADLWTAYRAALEQLGAPLSSTIFRRLFLSDGANQEAVISRSPFAATGESGPLALSLVQQAPLPEAKVALWAYHVMDPAGLHKEQLGHTVALRRGAVRHLWTAGLGDGGAAPDPHAQTGGIFREYAGELGALGATLSRDTTRTWIYVQNIDANYAGMVKARRELFAEHGLTPRSHFIASTGIEGRREDPRTLVSMDAYAVAGLRPQQLRYLQAPEHLGPTHLYGVTFERGVRVEHGDRCHVLISGTASIEPSGKTLHRGDVALQLQRAFRNIDALLAEAGAGRTDVAQLIVYLRDPADRAAVTEFLDGWGPALPIILVWAPVCRPDWLVEAECMAITESHNPGRQPF